MLIVLSCFVGTVCTIRICDDNSVVNILSWKLQKLFFYGIKQTKKGFVQRLLHELGRWLSWYEDLCLDPQNSQKAGHNAE